MALTAPSAWRASGVSRSSNPRTSPRRRASSSGERRRCTTAIAPWMTALRICLQTARARAPSAQSHATADGHLAAATSTGGLTNKVPCAHRRYADRGRGRLRQRCNVRGVVHGHRRALHPFVRSPRCPRADALPEPRRLARRRRQHRSNRWRRSADVVASSRCHTMANSRSHSIPLECSAAGCARATRRWRQFSRPDALTRRKALRPSPRGRPRTRLPAPRHRRRCRPCTSRQ